MGLWRTWAPWTKAQGCLRHQIRPRYPLAQVGMGQLLGRKVGSPDQGGSGELVRPCLQTLWVIANPGALEEPRPRPRPGVSVDAQVHQGVQSCPLVPKGSWKALYCHSPGARATGPQCTEKEDRQRICQTESSGQP